MGWPDRVDWLLNRPHYLYQPTQLLRRVRGPRDRIVLPWGLPLAFDPSDHIGLTLQHNGVYELAVTETLRRLADPGELALDVGANIGHMSSILAVAVAPGGEVLAFEPHPDLFERLEANVSQWKGAAPVSLRRVAVSNRAGYVRLTMTGEFSFNAGSASVEASGTAGESIEVPALTLDQEVGGREVGVLKVDVEGHEPAVLQGAEALLARGAIRDIVYEDRGYPGPASEILERHGYVVQALEQRIRGPRAVRPSGLHNVHRLPQNFLATRDPVRLQARLAPRGWRVLMRQRA